MIPVVYTFASLGSVIFSLLAVLWFVTVNYSVSPSAIIESASEGVEARGRPPTNKAKKIAKRARFREGIGLGLRAAVMPIVKLVGMAAALYIPALLLSSFALFLGLRGGETITTLELVAAPSSQFFQIASGLFQQTCSDVTFGLVDIFFESTPPTLSGDVFSKLTIFSFTLLTGLVVARAIGHLFEYISIAFSCWTTPIGFIRQARKRKRGISDLVFRMKKKLELQDDE